MAVRLLPLVLTGAGAGTLASSIGTIAGEDYKALEKGAERTRGKMSLRDYQRHIFALARGAESPVAKLARNRYSGHWRQKRGVAEKTLPDEFEQAAIVEGRDGVGQSWFSLDKTNREEFREKTLARLRKDFRKKLRSHPEFKDRSAKELSEIADAYLGGTDHDALKAEAVNAALQEVSDFVTGDGEVAMSDERTWRKSYPRKATAEKKEQGAEGSAGSESPAPLRNGTQISPLEQQLQQQLQNLQKQLQNLQQQQTPLNVTTAATYDRGGTSDTGIRMGGIPVPEGDASTRRALAGYTSNVARTAEYKTQGELGEARTDRHSDERQNYQRYRANQYALDANREAMIAERDAAWRDKRFKSRTLTSVADWENLGRNSTKRNFGKRAEGESNESWNARSGVVDAVDKLRDRFTKLSDTKDPKNELYAYNPNRMRAVSGLGNLFNQAVESGYLTDAQIEGLNKTFDRYENEGRKAKARIEERVALNDAENVRKYRKMYGMGDRDVFSDDDVKEFHKERQAAARREILQDMQVAPGQGGEVGRERRIRAFSDNWMKLIDNGLDVGGTFKEAMSDPMNREAFKKGVASISLDDPERADKVDQLRRRFVMNQAMRKAGLYDKVLKVDLGPDGKIRKQSADDNATALAEVMTRELPGTFNLPGWNKPLELRKMEDKVLGPGAAITADMDRLRARAAETAAKALAAVPAAETATVPAAKPATVPAAKPATATDGSGAPEVDHGDITESNSPLVWVNGKALNPTAARAFADQKANGPQPIPGKKEEATQQAAKGGMALRPRRRTS